MDYQIHKMINNTRSVNEIIKKMDKQNKDKAEISNVPDDVINNVTLDNWEEYFDKYLVLEVDGDRLSNEPKIYEYVWKPSILKEFIRKLLI